MKTWSTWLHLHYIVLKALVSEICIMQEADGVHYLTYFKYTPTPFGSGKHHVNRILSYPSLLP